MALGMILAAFALSAQVAPSVVVTLKPDRPLIERTHQGQAVNFDFVIANQGKEPVELVTIRAAVRDASGTVVQRLELNDNGMAPGNLTLPERQWEPGEAHTIFNPFHSLAPDVPLGRIDFEFLFRSGETMLAPATIAVTPSAFRQKTRLVMPMRGRLLVWDGHDFYAHHRRLDFTHQGAVALGINGNSGRYSLDLVTADAEGRFHAGAGTRRSDSYSWDQPVLAPGAGRVVAANGSLPDDPAGMSLDSYRADPLASVFGNHVIIDHGNGEYSQLGHLKRGSVRVKVGDRVEPGQEIARAGESGTSLFPHLHYQLTDGPGFDSEGLPARFTGLTRLLGRPHDPAAEAGIDSGDIVEAR